jgi:hypothetical protein
MNASDTLEPRGRPWFRRITARPVADARQHARLLAFSSTVMPSNSW